VSQLSRKLRAYKDLSNLISSFFFDNKIGYGFYNASYGENTSKVTFGCDIYMNLNVIFILIVEVAKTAMIRGFFARLTWN
jgi:hypothetical protein